MPKFLVLSFFLVVAAAMSFAQKKDVNFKIDGKTKDWEQVPGAQDLVGSADPNNPEPSGDVTFLADGYDDENVYLYFRRVESSEGPYSFFYFFDINGDGYMQDGEPVLSGVFTRTSVVRLAMNYFTSDLPSIFPYRGLPDCPDVPPWQKFRGSITEVFESSSIARLEHKEAFSAAVIDDGLGVEIAVPWRFLRHWLSHDLPLHASQLFYYRMSLQQGTSTYNASTVSDNAGGELFFGGELNIGSVGSFDETTSLNEDIIAQVSATTLVPGLSYTLTVNVTNLANRTAYIDLKDIRFLNLTASEGTIDATKIAVLYEGRPGLIESGTSASPPIIFNLDTLYILGSRVNGGFGEESSVSVDITFPNPISHADIEITPKIFYYQIAPCAGGAGDGGKPINPIGSTLDQSVQSLNKKASKPQSDQETKVIIYPIPSHGRVNVELPSSFGAVDLDLLDMSGKVVLRRAGVTTRSIELKDLTPGLYALQLYSPEYGVLIKKIVVMK